MSNPKTLLITGASRGLGRGLAELYAERGHKVFGCARGGSDFSHANYRHFICDVADDEAVRGMFRDIGKESDGIDVLVNNAGASLVRPALLTTGEDAEAVIQTNVLGAFSCMREAAKQMKRARQGRIINFTSISVPLESAGRALYSASKAALENLTATLARELAPDDITVNTIGPSIVGGSGMVEEMSEAALAEAREQLLKSATIEADEVAHAIDFLASDAARNITNQVIYFGGVR
ncbi:MAG: SDR family oxidoreductase [Proteobacteria bacterium]|nr:SDR family oxidoreductase [Pseudomonadota bacterium]